MAPAMPAEMMSLSQMPCAMPQTNQVNQVIVLVADPSTFPVAPVNYVAWCPQHSFQVPVPPVGPAGPALASLALPSSPSAQISPCAVGPCATPRTDVPSDDSDRDDGGARPRCSASTARRLRRKRAAERAKVANASGAPKVSLEDLRAQLRDDPAAALEQMRGRVWAWSRNDQGCRLVQEALESGREAQDLAAELEGHVLEAAMCQGCQGCQGG